MYFDRTQIPVDQLEIGMYVCELDRPWLETPFLFQGFTIENESVLNELREHCDYVFVTASRFDESCIVGRASSTASCSPKPGSSKPDGRQNGQKIREPSDKMSTRTPFDATHDLKHELAKIKDAHTSAQTVLINAFARIRSGKSISVEVINDSITPMVESICRNDDALSWLARMQKQDDYVYDHSLASAVWGMIFAKHLGLEQSEIQVLGLGTMLMDVGKTQISKTLLSKKERLTEAEMKTMQAHVKLGMDICADLNVPPKAMEIVQYHHERHNGTGYPFRLKANDIPVYARIAGIVDSFDAMTTPRPYAAPISTGDAMRMLNNLAGVEYQAEMVEQFIQAVGVFPVGSLVELSSGEVAVVVAQNRVRRLRPQIMILTETDRTLLKQFRTIDLRTQLVDDKGESLWIERGLPSDSIDIDPSELFI